MKKFFIRSIVFILCLINYFLFTKNAFAQKTDSNIYSIGITPSLINVDISQKEEQKTIDLVLINYAGYSQEIKISVMDFKQKDANGGLAFLNDSQGSYSYSLASFMRPEVDTVILGPLERKTIKVYIFNRPDLSPGGHYAVVTADLVNKLENKTRINPVVSSLILLRKFGGEKYNLSLKKVSFPNGFIAFSYPKEISLLFQNTGNIHMFPYGRLDIKDIFGRKLYKGIVNPQSSAVFPESIRYIKVDLIKLSFSLPLSLNLIDFSGSDSLSKSNFVYKNYFIYVNPIFLIVLVISLILLSIWRLKKSSRK
ncbi:MAG: hypothetical protein KatS3mg090_0689 [Patescibacteria group bacterium]|nr:MAG: hypothetical protein KatS3mg090_0689 [Patescibacteria group bacterium]